MTIVIVEDEARAREGLRRLIENLGSTNCVVGEASDGSAGMELIRQCHPDLIISDIRMPGMTGIEMISKLREEGVRSQVIFLTGYADFTYAQQAIKNSALDYLLKPISVEELEETLARAESVLNKVSAFSELKTENLLSQYLLSKNGEGDCMRRALCDRFEIGKEDTAPIFLTSFHTWGEGKGAIEAVFKDFQKQLERFFSPVQCIFFNFGNEYSFLCLFPLVPGMKESGVNSILKSSLCATPKAVAASCVCAGFHDLSAGVEKCTLLLASAKVLPQKCLITQEDVQQLCPEIFRYPDRLEKEFVRAMQSRNFEESGHLLHKITDYLRENCHEGSVMTNSFVHLFTTVLTACHVEGTSTYSQFEIMRHISGAVAFHEFTDILDGLWQNIQRAEQKACEKPCSPMVTRAVRYIEKNYSRDISLEQLAADLKVTPEYLSSVFSREIGASYIVYVTELRIHKAKELLSSGQHRICDVAKEVGYRDPKYFCSVFRKVTGYSPSKFMRANALPSFYSEIGCSDSMEEEYSDLMPEVIHPCRDT